MANRRIFYATQQATVSAVNVAPTNSDAVHGLQQLGVTTKFNLEQVFEIGQLAIYENIENLPEVEITMEKVLDGYPLIYHLATRTATAATIVGRSVARSTINFNIWPDTNESAGQSGTTPVAEVECSGIFLSSFSYTFPTQGNCTEQVTFVGNNKQWSSGYIRLSGINSFAGNNDSPQATGGVQRRENVLFGTGTGTCILPTSIPGITTGGRNPDYGFGSGYGAHITQMKVDCSLGREPLFELGRKGPYYRVVNFPVQAKLDIDTISSAGDGITAFEYQDNLGNESCIIRTDEGLVIDMGSKLKLENTTYGGANAGGQGGNATCTYSYITFNDCTVQHPADPATGLRP